MFDIFYTGPKPNLFPHELSCNSLHDASVKSKTAYFWLLNGDMDYTNFDFTWLPPVWEKHHTHIFPSQWQRNSGTMLSPKFGEYIPHYRVEQQVTTTTTTENWTIPSNIDTSEFDFSWHPDFDEEPYIYHFPASGIEYKTSNGSHLKYATSNTTIYPSKSQSIVDIEFDIFYTGPKPNLFSHEKHADSFADAQSKSSTNMFWFINGNTDYTNFDFTWLPPVWEKHHTHIFPSQWQRNSGTMLSPKFGEYIPHYRVEQQVTTTTTTENWTIPSNIDTSEFDFSWHPDFDEEPYIYHFPSPWHDTSGLVYTVPRASSIKFASIVANASTDANIFYVEHYNDESKISLQNLKEVHHITVTRFVDNYYDTLTRVATNAKSEYVWVINSICDYANFDFLWVPSIWQNSMLHVFPTNSQRLGDTFYFHVPTFLANIGRAKKLEDYQTINFCSEQSVSRFSPNVDQVEYDDDSVVGAIKAHRFTRPYAMFYPTDIIMPTNKFALPLWRKSDRLAYVLTDSGSVVVAPREIQSVLQTQLYDYEHILTEIDENIHDKPLDIIYISNGEPEAEKWYNHLVKTCNRPVKRVMNINGRSAAYKAAASMSDSRWFFAVFAKLEIDLNFDWDWQPDRMQEAKHYIFNATNPVNRLIYGHQAMIAYNKQLVLETEETGLDFTLARLHETVDIMSGIAHFNMSPIITWRTAFRECIKLADNDDAESLSRLRTWLTVATGNNAEWCLRGANDAVEYYRSVNGNMSDLMLTFEWQWLDEYFTKKYKIELQDQR